MFGSCDVSANERFFMIGSDNDMNSSSLFKRSEAAIDPTSGKPMFWSNGTSCTRGGDGTVSPQIFITHKYGITNFSFSGGCSAAQYIGFDHLGRPHVGFGSSNTPNQSSYMKTDCSITFDFDASSSIPSFNIIIEKETGYAYIDGQPNS